MNCCGNCQYFNGGFNGLCDVKKINVNTDSYCGDYEPIITKNFNIDNLTSSKLKLESLFIELDRNIETEKELSEILDNEDDSYSEENLNNARCNTQDVLNEIETILDNLNSDFEENDIDLYFDFLLEDYENETKKEILEDLNKIIKDMK